MNTGDFKKWFVFAKKNCICYSWNVEIYRRCKQEDESCGLGAHICFYCFYNDLGRQRHQSKGKDCPCQTESYNPNLEPRKRSLDDAFGESETRPSASNTVAMNAQSNVSAPSSLNAAHRQPTPAPPCSSHPANSSGASVSSSCQPTISSETSIVKEASLRLAERRTDIVGVGEQQKSMEKGTWDGHSSLASHRQPPPAPPCSCHPPNSSGALAIPAQQQPPLSNVREQPPSTESAGVASGPQQGGDVGEMEMTQNDQDNYRDSWKPNYDNIHRTFGNNNQQQIEVGESQKKRSAFNLPPSPRPPKTIQNVHQRGDSINNNSHNNIPSGNSSSSKVPSKLPPEQSVASERDLMADEIKHLKCIVADKDKQLNGLRSENFRFKNENLLLKAEVIVLKGKLEEDTPKAQPKTNPMFQMQGFGNAAHQNPMFQRPDVGPAPHRPKQMFPNQVVGPVARRQPKLGSLQNPVFQWQGEPASHHQRGTKQKFTLENLPPRHWLNGDGTITPF